ncbi:guanine nucleotide exchange factor synembryn-domain-containing protein [Epithele typhae]|uniref:guanine nucleotide exchange factor synembryn-domain-containing protein n=1 Tax=Epithele typhae TaxID=378194 RepID=UPI002007A053|nr:guanine nucleotide exchange factor synembryn-domain-containing protein [Epithele typhae]KAH9921571.1 guanine nucleotide exchange factor synembryn-domain-containing protein [Epithele typhae]
MSNYRDAYTALTAASSRSQVAQVLNSIADAPPLTLDDANRRTLIQSILADLPRSSSPKKSRLTTKDAAPALLALKSLGKNPAGSEAIATPVNLSALLACYSFYKDSPDASNEALRCIANAMLLVDSARSAFVEKTVGGGDFAVELLESFITAMVEAKSPSITDIIGSKLDLLSKTILSGTKFAREAMTDLLKFAFNLLLHYPRIVNESNNNEVPVMGEAWSDRLDGCYSPPITPHFWHPSPDLPRSARAPLTHVIHALITIPVSSALKPVWLPSRVSPMGTPKPPESSESSSKASRSSSSRGSSRAGSPTTGPGKDSKPGAFDRAWSALAAGRRSLSLSRPSSPLPSSNIDVLLRAYDLLDVSLSHYLPDTVDPDEASVRARCTKEMDSPLDDVMTPLVVLITRLCAADEGPRRRMREWLFPDDLDRTTLLESRADLLGRLLRLLQSTHHTKLKNSVGELLYAACDSDASTLSSFAGYGNVAGFLFNKGIMSAPPPPAGGSRAAAPDMTPSGQPIDPITGAVQREHVDIEMTEEEKEREAEKLFVLFDRLEKTGALPKENNPIRHAMQKAAGGQK